ncbi:MAG: outer membrane protein assembly factor, partial [Acidobacteriota bacterium]
MKIRRRPGGTVPLFLFACSVLLAALPLKLERAQTMGPGAAPAAEKIVDVRVEGNRRLSSAAFFRHTTLRSGQTYDKAVILQQFRMLWGTNMFDDLWVEALDAPGGKVVVFHVSERPVLLQVTYSKSSVVSTASMEDRLRDRHLEINLNEPLNRDRVRAVEAEIKRMHEEKGYLGTEVKAHIEPMGQNGQRIRFDIKLGAKTLIKKVKFTGNTIFSDRALKGMMENTMETGFKGIFSSKDLYHPVRFAQDLESVRTAYQAKGRLDIQIKPPIVDFKKKKAEKQKQKPPPKEPPPPPPVGETEKQMKKRLARLAKKEAKARNKAAKHHPPKRKAIITVPIEEGPEYRVGQISFSGNTVFDQELLRSAVPLQSGDVFNSDALRNGLDNIESLYTQKGYFYASTNREIHRQGESVADVNVAIREGKQYKIRTVEFSGNSSTKDRVLRRELVLNEGDIYNSRLWQIGLTRINQLGYWAVSREPELTPVPGQAELDATIEGTEQGRNEVQVGGGFSGQEGGFFQGSYATRNFLGRGEILQTAVQIGGRTQSVNISFTEPFFLGTRNTVGGSIFSRKIRFTNFDRDSSGFSLLFGQRLGNFSSYSVTYRNLRFDESGGGVFFVDVNSLPGEAIGFDAQGLLDGQFGTPILSGVKTTNSSLVPVFTFNTVNNPFRPTRGIRLQGSVQLTGSFLGGDNEFFKSQVRLTYYRPAFRRTFFAFHGEMGTVSSLNSKLIPRSERFFIGGDTRGPRVFQTRSLAPLGPVSGIVPLADSEGNIVGIPFAVVGGDSYLLSQNEFVLRVTDPFDIALFLDMGNAFDNNFGLSDLRFSAGIEARFFLPIFQAPLRLIFGRVLDEKSRPVAGASVSRKEMSGGRMMMMGADSGSRTFSPAVAVFTTA